MAIALTGVRVDASAAPTWAADRTGPLADSSLYTADGTSPDILAADVSHAEALSGVSRTVAIGTVVQSTTLALTGSAGTAAAGTALAGVPRALTGVSGTSAAGSLVQSKTVALGGLASTGAAGSVVQGVTQALTGVPVTSSAGTLPTHSTARALTGTPLAAAGGSVGLAQALTGVASTANPVPSPWFADNAILTADTTLYTADGSLPGSLGNVVPATAVAPAGIEATAWAGTPAATGAIVLQPILGVSATASAGLITPMPFMGHVPTKHRAYVVNLERRISRVPRPHRDVRPAPNRRRTVSR